MATVYWIASGDDYMREAAQSARTVAQHMPNVKRILLAPDIKHFGGAFTEERKLPQREHGDWYIDSTRYFGLALEEIEDEYQIWMDTDTWTCNPFPELFTALDRYDFIATHAPGRGTSRTVKPIPAAFCEVNIGVIAVRKNEKTLRFAKEWHERYLAHQDVYQTDQGALRETLWNSDLRIWIAPPEYNMRWGFGGFARLPIRILHGRPQDGDYNRVCREVNWSRDLRAWRRGQIS